MCDASHSSSDSSHRMRGLSRWEMDGDVAEDEESHIVREEVDRYAPSGGSEEGRSKLGS